MDPTLILNPPLVAHIHVMDVLVLKVLISLIVPWWLKLNKTSGPKLLRVIWAVLIMKSIHE